jgi:signal transduction histidine kinase
VIAENDSVYEPPQARLEPDALRRQVEWVSRHPVIRELLSTIGGIVAVLNEARQVLGVNRALLEDLGVADAEGALGLRPGEVFHCAHAGDGADGCGSGGACSSCGAALAMVVSLSAGRPVERECALAVEKDGRAHDRVLHVRSAPMLLDGERLLLLVLTDVTDDHWRSELERAFYHDVNNVLCGMLSAAELLDQPRPADPELLAMVIHGARRLSREIEVQRALTRGEPQAVRLRVGPMRCADAAESMRRIFATHPVARDRKLRLHLPFTCAVSTDTLLLERVLSNMLTNAFEAVPPGGEVRLAVEEVADGVVFSVHNAGVVAPSARLRMFQAHFSTKPGGGRGLGTYSMRLFGEAILGGRVGFTSSEAEGTTFRLWLPLEARAV